MAPGRCNLLPVRQSNDEGPHVFEKSTWRLRPSSPRPRDANSPRSSGRKEIKMARQPRVKAGSRQSEKPITAKVSEDALPIGLLPPTFEADYVAGAVEPFLLSGIYLGETPSLPMIDLALSKEKAIPIQLWGMLYEGWTPEPEEEGRTVFMQGYENRGPNNERKKIYMSATTPDLFAAKYRDKIAGLYERCLAG